MSIHSSLDDSKGPKVASGNVGRGLLMALCLATVGCEGEVSQEQRRFYALADAVREGQSVQDVSNRLGEPTRTVAAQGPCLDMGGAKMMVYESVTTSQGREPLRAGSIMYCVSRDDTIISKLTLHQ